ncbi:MAG: hypothetical protein ABFC96_12355 [Thermoguttaceae bacterium]
MKSVQPIVILLALATTAYGQPPTSGSGSATQPAAPQQVLVRFEIIEMSLTKLRHMGVHAELLTGDNLTADRRTPNSIVDGKEAVRLLATLRSQNLVKTLATSRLIVLSGKTGTINAGRELSFPTRRPDGSVAIERRHATEATVSPIVHGDNVQLTFHARRSEPDSANPMTVGEETIPGIRDCEVNTRAQLKSDQTLILREPIHTVVETELHGAPIISELPYVGAMFRSVKETRNEIAVVILVHSEIVQSPARATNSSPAAGVPRVAAWQQGSPTTGVNRADAASGAPDIGRSRDRR